MPIREETDQNLNGSEIFGYFDNLLDVNLSGLVDGAYVRYDAASLSWLPVTGILPAPSTLDSLSDVDTASATASGRALIWNGTSWIAGHPTGAGVGGVATLDDLTDTVITSPTVHQTLAYNGSNWINSGVLLNSLFDVDTSSATASGRALIWNGATWIAGHPTGAGAGGVTTLAALTDITLTNPVHGHGLVYNQNIAEFANAYGMFSPTGLIDGGATYNTTVLQNALNQGGIVYIPSGIFLTHSLVLSKDRTQLVGQGTLLIQSGYQEDAGIIISGNNCKIEGITVDGNRATHGMAVGRGEGIGIVGDYNTVRGVRVLNVPTGGSANSIAIRFADNNLVENCFVSGAGFAAYYCNGDHNTFRNNIATHYRAKGFTFNGGPYKKLTIDGFYSVNPIAQYDPNTGGAALQVDPGPNATDFLNYVSIRNVFAGNGFSGGACAKFAKIGELVIEDSIFYPTEPNAFTDHDIKIAENIRCLTINRSWFVGVLNFDSTLGNLYLDRCRFGEHPDSLVVNNGSGYNPVMFISDLQVTGVAKIYNCDFYGHSNRAIDIDNPTVEENPAIGYQFIDIQDCSFIGSGAGTIRDFNFTSAGSVGWSRRWNYQRNTRRVVGGGTPIITTSTWYPLMTPMNTAMTQYAGLAAPTSASIRWQVGDEIVNTGATSIGSVLGWRCIVSGNPGTWVPYGIIPTIVHNNYYDVTYYGVSNTGENVTTALRSFFNTLPNNTTVKFPPGIYYITGTIRMNQKVNIQIDAKGAEFRENQYQLVSGHAYPLCSGMFYLYYCTGINFMGGVVSGAASMNEIYSLASGMVCSGYGSDSFGEWATDAQTSRNVVSTTFNLEQCSNITIEGWSVRNKYRFGYTYRGLDIFFRDNIFLGVLSGISYRNQLTTTIGPTGNEVQIGDIHKLAARQNYCLTLVKGRNVQISEFHTQNCGGLLSAGSSSLGGGQGPAIAEQIYVDHCSMKNSYDNHIYFSSVYKARVSDCVAWNEETLNHIPDGMKGRGHFIEFDNCQIYNSHHGFGIEGISASDAPDYWTNGASPGWSSQGSRISRCVASNIGGYGIFLDSNDDDTVFPRDCTIEGNYLINCGLGAYGRSPTGFIAGEGLDSAVITAYDAYRVRIINNTIENSGTLQVNQAIWVGRNKVSMWISGCVVANNTFLGSKVAIRAVGLANAQIYGNYGERIGYYGGAPYLEQSGSSAFIVTDNIKDSRIYDNVLAPTGHTPLLWTIPGSSFTNIRRRDNDGVEIIN